MKFKVMHCGGVIAVGETRIEAEDNALKAHWKNGYKYHVSIVSPTGEISGFFQGDECPSQFGPLNVPKNMLKKYTTLKEKMRKLGFPV